MIGVTRQVASAVVLFYGLFGAFVIGLHDIVHEIVKAVHGLYPWVKMAATYKLTFAKALHD